MTRSPAWLLSINGAVFGGIVAGVILDFAFLAGPVAIVALAVNATYTWSVVRHDVRGPNAMHAWAAIVRGAGFGLATMAGAATAIDARMVALVVVGVGLAGAGHYQVSRQRGEEASA